MRIGIVGPEESKWTEEQIPKVRLVIRNLLVSGKVEPEEGFYAIKDTILVSGHCPKGKERWYCVDCHSWCPTEFVDEGEGIDCNAEHEGHKLVKVYDKGGVDTWAEIIATELGIKKEIYPATCTYPRTKGFFPEECYNYLKSIGITGKDHMWGYHYKPRNIQIAEAGKVKEYVLYCIAPFIRNSKCNHHYPFTLHHPQNGGCWTMKYAEKLGKEVHLVVIE